MQEKMTIIIGRLYLLRIFFVYNLFYGFTFIVLLRLSLVSSLSIRAVQVPVVVLGNKNNVRTIQDNTDEYQNYQQKTTTIPDTSSKKESSIGLYIHIPFCRRRCRYCDFAIVPIGPNVGTSTTSTDDIEIMEDTNNLQQDQQQDQQKLSKSDYGFFTMVQNYTTAIRTEIQLLVKQQQISKSKSKSKSMDDDKIIIQSIYFGGGTPSLAPIEMLQCILNEIIVGSNNNNNTNTNTNTNNSNSNNETVTSPFQLSNDCEITIEMDPGTFSKQKLIAIRDMGFNRISLGIQSFHDTILESLGRVHRVHDIVLSLEMLQDVYGDQLNLSIDLISGLPGLSLAQWTHDLYTAININPKPSHISVYDLQIESGTVFGKWYSESSSLSESKNNSTYHRTRGESNGIDIKLIPLLPSEHDSSFMYKYTSNYLQANQYEHYEISSYARLVPFHKNTTLSMQLSPSTLTSSTSTSVGKIHNENENDIVSSRRSRHNQIYWGLDTQWYAFGLGATSYVNEKMIVRPRTYYDYLQWVSEMSIKCNVSTITSSEEEVDNDDDDDCDDECDDDDKKKKKKKNELVLLDTLMDIILKRLRTVEGLSLNWIRQYIRKQKNKDNKMMLMITEEEYIHSIIMGAQLGLELGFVEFNEKKQILRLTQPDGFLYSNTIISSIFATIEELHEKRNYKII